MAGSEAKLKSYRLGFAGDGHGVLTAAAVRVLEHAGACQALALGPGLRAGMKPYI